MAHDVFICYAKEDEQIADAVCKVLEDRGIGCWYAKRDVLFGTPFEVSIIEAISKSRLMLLVLSSHSNSSPHVTREIQNAFAEEVMVTVIPFRVEAIELSPALKYYLRSVQWLDASTPPLESHLERLGEYVELHLPESKETPPREVIEVEKRKHTGAKPGQQVETRERQKVKAEQAGNGRSLGRRRSIQEQDEIEAREEARYPGVVEHTSSEEFYADEAAQEAARKFVQEENARRLAVEEQALRADEEQERAAEAERRLAAAQRRRRPEQEPYREEIEPESHARDEQAEAPEQPDAQEKREGFFKQRNRRIKQIVVAASILLVVGITAAAWVLIRPGRTMTGADHIASGDMWAKQNKWDRAETEYRKAIQMDPNQANWHHHLGDALYFQGKYEGAEAAYKMAVQLEENNSDYHAALALTQMQQQNWKDAAARFEKVVSLNKNDYRWWNKLGVCYYSLQNYKASEGAFRQVSELVKGTGKNFAYLHINLGDAFYAQRNWADAITEYREGVRIGSAGNSEADKATYQERLDNAIKAQADNPSTVAPPQLLPRNYKN